MPRNRSAEPEKHQAIGARLRHARMRKGLSQSQLGEVIGVSFQQMQKYELGRNCLTGVACVKLAAALDVSVSYLLGGAEGESETRVFLMGQAAYEAATIVEQLPVNLRRQAVLLLRSAANLGGEPLEASAI
ncbi:helix-turn-helix domain-containing protein [Xanthobacter sp. DSM 14520]|uniref:helix-turn-helix domain-containing protein n=1 Tax=Xanthobacter autotrophicus (strain ATCC BAA-1158 / Py2) TaxID=78245 RepID=UPI00372A55AA